MTRLRAVLFDAVGTLIELREPVGQSYAREARRQGVALAPERLETAFARALKGAEPMVFPGADGPARERQWWRRRVEETFRGAGPDTRMPDFDACFDALWRHFAAAAAWRPRPGAGALLTELRSRGFATGVVSNFDRRLPALLDALGLAADLDAVVLPSDAGAAKPDPRIFRFALDRLGVPAAAALHVGDHPQHDLAGARRAGLHAVGAADLAKLGERIRHLDPSRPSQEFPR